MRQVFTPILISFFAAAMFVSVGQAQVNTRVPEASMSLDTKYWYMERDLNTTPGEYSTEHNIKPTSIAADAKLVGKMINAYTAINPHTRQIWYDPFSGALAVIYRANRAVPGNGSLTYKTSTDKGDTWSNELGTINLTLPNSRGQLSARHPSIMLSNPTKSTNTADVRVAALWSNLETRWKDLVFASGSFGGTTFAGGRLPTPPDWLIAYDPVVNLATGDLFSIVEGIDPGTGNALNEYYILKSTDKGKTWNLLAMPAIMPPLPDGYQVYTAKMDISPDGKVMTVGFVGILVESGRFSFINNRLGMTSSTDGGNTWSQVQFKTMTDLRYDVPFDATTGFMYPSFDMVLDANADPHFLITITSDNFFPLDSTFVGEVRMDENQNWEFRGLAYINNPWVQKFANIGNTPPGQPQPKFSIYNEHQWAKSVDGYKLWAKWIDTDSLFKFVRYDPQTQLPVLARDTIHDIYTAGYDIRSNTASGGWAFKRITQTPAIDEKHSKIAPYVGDDNRLYYLYTIWGFGDVGDDDDLAPSDLFFVTDVVDVAVGVEDTPGAAGAFNLGQNYPNPFNPSTMIPYSVPKAGHVSLKVFDMLGREVATLVNEVLPAGSYKAPFIAGNLQSGMYIYRLETGGKVTSRKMLLTK
ncbi:MAG: T9SS type A sorting domain-containing protein [Chlorobi bacterium]|nr:T9SS type A sorting domain-containing protein [Chlorobiota bacterium]